MRFKRCLLTESSRRYYYHITPKNRLKSILKNGLIIGSKEVFGEIISRKNNKKYIHVSANKKSLLKLATIEHPEIDWVLLKIDLSDYELKPNKARHRDNFFITDKSISPDRIKLIK